MPTALVTGASTGLGKLFCELFAADGINVVMTSSPRSCDELGVAAETLRSTYGVSVERVSIDLAQPGAADALRAEVDLTGMTIDYVENNAGFGIVGLPMQRYSAEDFSRMIYVNVFALAQLTMSYVPEMVEGGSGRILNVSSIAGYVVPHGLECGYAATKAFVVSLSEGLSRDLAGTGVTCTHLAPGPTRTNFFSTAGLEGDGRRRLQVISMDAGPVARAGYRAMMRGKPSVMPGVGNQVMRAAAKFSPSRAITARLSGYFVER